MNVSPGQRSPRRPGRPTSSRSHAPSLALGQLGDVLLGKGVTLALAAVALTVGLATFIILARGSPLGWKPGVGVGLVLANLSVLLLLGAVLAGRLTRVWVERRRGSAGSRLHVRLVLPVQRRRRRAHHRGRLLRRRVLPFRHPVLVQRPGAHRAGGIAAGRARLPGGASQQHPRRRAGDGQRPGTAPAGSCRPIPPCSPRCWTRRPRCAA